MLFPIGRKKLNYVVVGTGRCGTVYFAKLLTTIGIPCGHERVFGPDGLKKALRTLEKGGGQDSAVARDSGHTSGNLIIADASYMAVPYLDHGCLRDALVIHAVRNPVDVILSFNNKLQYFSQPNYNQWEAFITSHISEIKRQGTPLERNACYVVRWNEWIERQCEGRPYVRVRLEKDTDKLLDFLAIPGPLRPALGVENSHESWKLKRPPLARPAHAADVLGCSWGPAVRRLAERYDYEI